MEPCPRWRLISHLWIPLIVLGTAGTASVIRTIRANLLDELHKPYVLTARAKGLGERRLTLKYPVRHSLNPFVSGLNDIFVNIISAKRSSRLSWAYKPSGRSC